MTSPPVFVISLEAAMKASLKRFSSPELKFLSEVSFKFKQTSSTPKISSLLASILSVISGI